MNTVGSNSLSMKYQNFTPTDERYRDKKFKFVAKTPFLSWPRCIYTYVNGAMYTHLCKNSALSKIKEGKGGVSQIF